jgi:hypothetical protein
MGIDHPASALVAALVYALFHLYPVLIKQH